MSQLPAIVIFTPLFAAILCALIGGWRPSLCLPIALLGLTAALAAAIQLLRQVASEPGTPISYHLGGWQPPFGIEFRVDAINALLLTTIAAVGLLAAIYSKRAVPEESPGKAPQFYTLFLLLLTGLLGMSITADAFNLFVLLEVSSLTSYALIAMGPSPRGTLAAFHYVIMGTIGASFYLLGVGYLYLKTGTLNMADIRDTIAASDLAGATSIQVALIFIMVGLFIKMAFFPLFGWLPNAYSFCPSTTGVVLAPLVTKVSVYVMVRTMLFVFGGSYIFSHVGWSTLVVWLAVIAILAGSIYALAQTDLKKMLCFLIVAEVGYMVGGAWLEGGAGMTGTIFHIISDAAMTCCLFLAAGILFRKLGTDHLQDLRGLFKRMPLTSIPFILGAAAMVGIPPTCGFFSKWYLIQGGIAAGRYEYVAALLISSLINAILFFRIIEIGFFPKSVEAEPAS